MKHLLYTIVLSLLTYLSVLADGFLRLSDEINLPVPDGWELISDTDSFPFQLVRFDPPAEMLLFKSDIYDDDLIRHEEDLKMSVDIVISDVIMTIPGAELISSKGFMDGHRTSFLLEFLSDDSTSEVQLRHRFNGIIYLTEENHQVLYTLWGKASIADFIITEGQMKMIQEGFERVSSYHEEVFVPDHTTFWSYFTLLGLLLGLFFMVRRRRSLERSTQIENYWRCMCGRNNSGSYNICEKCGRPQEAKPE